MIFEREELEEFEKEAWLLLDYEHKPTEPSRVAFYRDSDRSYFIGGIGKTKVSNKDSIEIPLCNSRNNHYRMVVISNFHRDRLGKIYYFLSHLEDEKEVWDLAGMTLVHSYKDGDYTYDSTVDHFRRKAPSESYVAMEAEEFLASIRDLVDHPYVDITFRNQGVDVLSGYEATGKKLFLACKRDIKLIDFFESDSIIEKMFKDAATNGTLLLSSIEVDRLIGLLKIFFVESYTRTVFLGTCDKLGIFEPFFEFARAEKLDCSTSTHHALSRYGSLGLTHEMAIKAIAPGFRSKMSFKTMGRFLEIADGLMEYNSGQYEDNIERLTVLLNTPNKNKKGPFFETIDLLYTPNKNKKGLFFEDNIDYLYEVMDKDGIQDCLNVINKQLGKINRKGS